MNDKQAPSNSHLLYSEYIETNAAKQVVQLIERKEKPVMKFTRSSVLPKILDLLPRLKASEEELNTKDENERNIEVCADNSPIIEMNVAIPKGFKDNESEDISSADESNDENVLKENDSEESSDENTLSNDDSEESDEENLHLSNYCLLHEQKSLNNSLLLQSENPIKHDFSSKLAKTKLCSTSKSLNLVPVDLTSSEDSGLEPPTKRLCQLLD